MAGSVAFNLLPEITKAGARQLLTPLRTGWRRSWFYRRRLKGQLSDHIVFHPHDALPRKLEEADALLRGRFRFCGEVVDVPQGQSVFDLKGPSRGWSEALNSFAWLPPLALAGGEASRTLATNLIAQWVKRNGRYSEPNWLAHIMARRLMHLFSHIRLVVLDSEMTSALEAVRVVARKVAHAGTHQRRSAPWLAAAGSGGGAGAVNGHMPG